MAVSLRRVEHIGGLLGCRIELGLLCSLCWVVVLILDCLSDNCSPSLLLSALQVVLPPALTGRSPTGDPEVLELHKTLIDLNRKLQVREGALVS